MGKRTRYVVRVDDTVTNEIIRTLQSEPHVIDETTGKEYFLRVSNGVQSLMEQSDPTTQVSADVSLDLQGIDVIKLALMNM